MDRFRARPTQIDGLFTVSKTILGDNRGYLERLYCFDELECWNKRAIAQVNRTFTSKKGTVRGLHFQYPPYAEAKFICCLQGRVMDLALDLRKSSVTFGKIFIIELDEQLHNAVLIPEGVAHGFQTLSDNVEMLYFHSKPYSCKFEAGINILDNLLSIEWKLPCIEISERDKNFPFFRNFKGVDL